MTKPTLTTHQADIAKRLRGEMRARIDNGDGGMTFKGNKGVGKTRMIGGMNSKAPTSCKHFNLFVACQAAYAVKHMKEVGVACHCMPLTLGRVPMLLNRLGNGTTGATTFTITPTSAVNMLNPKHKLHDEMIKSLKKKHVTRVNLQIDEVHKTYKGRSNRPAQVDAFRNALHEEGILLVVTGITATPLWDVEGKDQKRLATRACTLLGLKTVEGQSPVEMLTGNMVEVSDEEARAIFATTRSLQTPAPETFTAHEIDKFTVNASQELEERMGHAKELLLGLAIDGMQGHIDRLVGFKACLSMAVVQKVLDDHAIESVLPEAGVQCKTVIEH